LPGYRAGNTSVSYSGSGNGASSSGDNSLATFFGATVVPEMATSWTASGSITLVGGPEDPVGNSYTIQTPLLEEAFADVDGTQYYRKTVISATIPEQV